MLCCSGSCRGSQYCTYWPFCLGWRFYLPLGCSDVGNPRRRGTGEERDAPSVLLNPVKPRIWFCGLTFDPTPTAEAAAVSPVADDGTTGRHRAHSACPTGSGVERGVRPHSVTDALALACGYTVEVTKVNPHRRSLKSLPPDRGTMQDKRRSRHSRQPVRPSLLWSGAFLPRVQGAQGLHPSPRSS